MIFRLYVGSNNKTKKLEKSKAIKTTGMYFDGFSAYEIIGYWRGQAEKTLLIEIETMEKTKVLELSKKLVAKLQQQAIGMVQTEEQMRFIK